MVSGVRNTQDVNMATGWNLVGCPANAHLPIEEVLASIDGKFVSVWHYEAVDGEWRHFDPEKPVFLNDLLGMEPGKAYWVEMNADGQLVYVEKPAKIHFYHPDHLGSSNVVTDLDGGVVESTEFYPYGRPRYEERHNFDSAYKYTGKELDEESGLMYYEARYYDPVVGRFVSVDPLYLNDPEKDLSFPEKLNLYYYVSNNPINGIDPSGLDLILVGEAGNEGHKFKLAAQTWKKENPGKHSVRDVSTGEQAIKIMKEYAKSKGSIEGLQVFAHSWEEGIGFNAPGNADLFKQMPKGSVKGAASIDQIDPKWFSPDAKIKLWGCNTAATGEHSFAQALANRLNLNVIGATGFTTFSGIPNVKHYEIKGNRFSYHGKLPWFPPKNYSEPVYMVPEKDSSYIHRNSQNK